MMEFNDETLWDKIECEDCLVRKWCEMIPNAVFYDDSTNSICEAILHAYEQGKHDGRGEVD